MERAVQVFALVHLVTMGLSHLVVPRVWVRFFVLLREKGEAGVFVVGFMSLGFGSIIVAFHSVWTGWALVLTLLGWAQIAKALIYFVIPAHGLRMLDRVSLEKANDFRIAGVGLLVIALFVALALRQG